MDINKRGRGIIGFRRWIDTPVLVEVGHEQSGRTWSQGLRDTLSGAGKQDTYEGEPRMGIVDLQASGWGFVARDMSGGVWAWGESSFPFKMCCEPKASVWV